MRMALIVTVAGASTRFRKSVGKDCLKCIYTEKSEKETLLYALINTGRDFDRIIIVGGYKFDDLSCFVRRTFPELVARITLVKNDHFEDYGSGYSLYLGVSELRNSDVGEVVFAEGDLFFDSASFEKIKLSPRNVITTNGDPIEAKKVVAFYMDTIGRVKYIYDTNHSALEVNEPFSGIYNSGQVWKLCETDKLFASAAELTEMEKRGTNLVLLQRYLDKVDPENLQVIHFGQWFNCNTVEDYRLALKM